MFGPLSTKSNPNESICMQQKDKINQNKQLTGHSWMYVPVPFTKNFPVLMLKPLTIQGGSSSSGTQKKSACARIGGLWVPCWEDLDGSETMVAMV